MPSKVEDAKEPVADPMLASLPGEQILQTNSLGTVTDSWIIIRPAYGRSRVLLSIETITDIRRIKTSHPALVVIASGLFLIAAAASYSKDGGGAAIPAGVLGLLFILGFLLSRRGSVLITSGLETTETVLGSLRQARELIRAVQRVRTMGVVEPQG